MIPDKNLSELFGKFAGREVNATEQTHTHTFKSLGTTVTSTSVIIDEKDPAVAELTAAVEAAGYELRLWTPSVAGTADWVDTRVNAYVEKAADGKYRITSEFRLG